MRFMISVLYIQQTCACFSHLLFIFCKVFAIQYSIVFLFLLFLYLLVFYNVSEIIALPINSFPVLYSPRLYHFIFLFCLLSFLCFVSTGYAFCHVLYTRCFCLCKSFVAAIVLSNRKQQAL